MNLDLTDEDVNLLLRAHGELPAKVSNTLLGKIGELAAAENRRRQQAPPTSEGLAAGTD
jgi:hypothetical protein